MFAVIWVDARPCAIHRPSGSVPMDPDRSATLSVCVLTTFVFTTPRLQLQLL
jgi:hypothetical protein